MKVEILVSGVAETVATCEAEMLRRDAAVVLALTAARKTCYAEAYKHCPVGTPQSTGKPGYVGGQMRNSIKELVITSRPMRYYVMGVSTNVTYSKYVELGTYKMKAQPFLYPAFLKGVDALFAVLEASGG